MCFVAFVHVCISMCVCVCVRTSRENDGKKKKSTLSVPSLLFILSRNYALCLHWSVSLLAVAKMGRLTIVALLAGK